MTYIKTNPQPANLSANETGLTLDDGTTVAVSVVPTWLDNGAGVSFLGTARYIDAQGVTRLSPHDQPILTSFVHAEDPSQVATSDQINSIAKEMLLALLGEPPTTTLVNGVSVDVLPLSADVRANVNIRTQIATATATGPTAVNPASVLGV